MMGPTKLSVIREQVRKSFKMTDAELTAWFDRQFKDRERRPEATSGEINTLRLLRDALKREVKRGTPKGKRRRTSAAN